MKWSLLLVISLICIVGCGGGDWDDKQTEKKLAQIEQSEAEQAAALSEQDMAITRTRLRALSDEADELLQTLKELEQEIEKWQDFVPELLTNDRGRVLASNPAYVETYIQFTEKRRPDRDDVDAIRRRVEEVRKSLDQTIKSKSPALSERNESGFRETLASETASATADLRSFRENRSTLEALASDSQTSTARTTLEEAIAQRRIELERARAEEIARRRQIVFESHTDSVAALEARLEEEHQQTKLRELAQERLLVQAADENIIAKFAVFTQPGRTGLHRLQISNRSSTPQGTLCMTAFDGPSRPVSYKKLIEIGAIENAQNFAWVTSHKLYSGYCGVRNDRPTWTYPQTDADWDQLKSDFELFKTLAPIWAKDGTLAP